MYSVVDLLTFLHISMKSVADLLAFFAAAEGVTLHLPLL
jgi:hypothetical protein